MNIKYTDIVELKGKVFTEIKVVRNDVHKFDHIIFKNDSETYIMIHNQRCCENVIIEDICGNVEDLIGLELLIAEEASSDKYNKESFHSNHDSYTFTFYRFATINGYVTIRWYGTSNGHYSESVSILLSKANRSIWIGDGYY